VIADETSDIIVASGLIGLANENITNCYTTSDVILEINEDNNTVAVGGVIGTTMNAFGASSFHCNIENCYAVGAIDVKVKSGVTANVSTGGLVGNTDGYTTITNCMAFNPAITTTPALINTGRILGYDGGTDLSSNYANKCMLVNGVVIADDDSDYGDDQLHGEHITYINATTGSTVATYYPGWDFSGGGDWTFNYAPDYNVVTSPANIVTNLPILQAFTIDDFPEAKQPPHLDCAKPTATLGVGGALTQETCLNDPITPIVINVTGATGVSESNLPAGVSGTWTTPTQYTISGAPSTTTGSPFNYTVTFTTCCDNTTLSGTITVRPTTSLSLADFGFDDPQTLCVEDGNVPLPSAANGISGIWKNFSEAIVTEIDVTTPTTTTYIFYPNPSPEDCYTGPPYLTLNVIIEYCNPDDCPVINIKYKGIQE
jgi:hypothetical protein